MNRIQVHVPVASRSVLQNLRLCERAKHLTLRLNKVMMYVRSSAFEGSYPEVLFWVYLFDHSEIHLEGDDDFS